MKVFSRPRSLSFETDVQFLKCVFVILRKNDKNYFQPRALIEEESGGTIPHEDLWEETQDVVLLFAPALATQGWESTSEAVSRASEFLRRRQETRCSAEEEMEAQARRGKPRLPAVMARSSCL